MGQNFGGLPETRFSPAVIGANITPSDSTVFEFGYRILYIGGAGNLRILTMGDSDVTLKNVPAGTQLWVSVKRVFAAGTTASEIVGLS